jgi:hypothetical protein
MIALQQTNSLQDGMVAKIKPNGVRRAAKAHENRIKDRLKELGVTKMARMSSEARYLPKIIHQDEEILGVVYGKSESGFAYMIATDKRAIFLDKKPLFVNEDEITYNVVSGVSYGHVGVGSTVTLHTRLGDYKVKTFNEHCAQNFVKVIETRCLEHEQ